METSDVIDKAYGSIFPHCSGADAWSNYVAPAATYCIAMLQRSGSTMLCGMLEQTRVLGMPGEYLSPRGPMQVQRDKYKSPTFSHYMTSVVADRCTPNRVFGLKATYQDFKPLEASGLIGRVFPGIKFVYLTRRNLVAQAVSAEKARTSGLWHKKADGSALGSKQSSEAKYDKNAILAALRGIIREQQEWELFFLLYRISPLRLLYEAVCEDPRRAIQDVLSYVGVNTEVPLGSIVSPTMRLSDSTNGEWEDRFAAEFSLGPTIARVDRGPPQ